MSVFQKAKSAAMAVALLSAIPAIGTPLSLFNAMRDTPITRFSQADVDLMTRTVQRALDTGADDVTVTWENQRNASGGSVTPARDPEGRKNCRLAQVQNRHRALQNTGTYVFCRSNGQATGSWQVIGLAPSN